MSVKELSLGLDDDGDVELKEVEDINLEGDVTMGRENWTCEELVPITLPIVCRVPQKVVIFMRSVERVMVIQGMGALEFGVFLKGKFEDGELSVDGDAHFIPKQKVSGATIDFEEDAPDDSYNGVIHRHPTGCKGFSGTDAHHINRNFEFSLLYEGNDIITGIINVVAKDVRIQLPLKIEVAYPVFNIENEDLIARKIHRNQSMLSSTRSSRDYRQRGLAGLLTDGEEEDDGILPFGDRETIADASGVDREDDDSEYGDLYICRYCGEPNWIEEFPFTCESCDMILNGDDDAEFVIDMFDIDSDIQAKALEKLNELKQLAGEEEAEEDEEDV